MTAKRLVRQMGNALVGRAVLTMAIGDYPGGNATVTEMAPDPAAPEIVSTVEHATFGSIGVVEWEQETLLPD